MPLVQTFHSVRYLKPSQIAWRLWYAARRRFNPTLPVPPATLESHPAPETVLTPEAPAWDQTTLNELAEGRFTFFHLTMALGRGPVDWKLGSQSQHRLWIISLHYHSWLYRLAAKALTPSDPDAEQARTLFTDYLDDWLVNADISKPGSRALAWNSYACASRLSWWARFLWHPDIHTLLTPQRTQAVQASVWKQARFIESNPEYDLRANHLLRDMLGLVYAGRILQGSDGQRWLRKGSDLALQQVREQVLPDGGHFERSPMYHLHVMDDVLALACLSETPAQRSEFRDTWLRMAHALGCMVHPDGLVALFNDAAFNGSETPAHALHAGQKALSLSVDGHPLKPIEILPDFGFIRLADPQWTVFFDVGRIGVDYQPGHAHADTLSLEASLGGQRLLIDPGTIAYDKSPARNYDRSTAAHNTLTIDNCNSTEVWDIFRVARRALPCDVQFANHTHGPTAGAAHDGYDRLPGKPRHARQVALSNGALLVTDSVRAAKGHTLSGGWLLAPGVTAAITPQGIAVTLAGKTIDVTLTGATPAPQWVISPASYHPNFGEEIATTRIHWTLTPQTPDCTIQTTFKPA